MLILVISLFKETELLLTSLQTARPVTLRVSNTHLDTSETWAPLSVAIAAATKPEGPQGPLSPASPRGPTGCPVSVGAKDTSTPTRHHTRGAIGPGPCQGPLPRGAHTRRHALRRTPSTGSLPSLCPSLSVTSVHRVSVIHPSPVCQRSIVYLIYHLLTVSHASSICLSPFNSLSLSTSHLSIISLPPALPTSSLPSSRSSD